MAHAKIRGLRSRIAHCWAILQSGERFSVPANLKLEILVFTGGQYGPPMPLEDIQAAFTPVSAVIMLPSRTLISSQTQLPRVVYGCHYIHPVPRGKRQKMTPGTFLSLRRRSARPAQPPLTDRSYRGHTRRRQSKN